MDKDTLSIQVQSSNIWECMYEIWLGDEEWEDIKVEANIQAPIASDGKFPFLQIHLRVEAIFFIEVKFIINLDLLKVVGILGESKVRNG